MQGDINPPRELADMLAMIAGEDWPYVSEIDLLRRAEAYEQAYQAMEKLQPRFVDEVNGIFQGLKGSGAQAIRDMINEFLVGKGTEEDPGAFNGAIMSAKALAENLRKTSNNVETAKISIIAMAAMVVAELIAAGISLFFTFGASGPAFAALIKMTALLAKKLVFQLIKSILMGALMMVAINGLAQAIQIARGHRNGFDLGELGMQAALGAAGGVIGFGLGKSLDFGLGKTLGKNLAKKLGDSFLGETIKDSLVEGTTEHIIAHGMSKITGEPVDDPGANPFIGGLFEGGASSLHGKAKDYKGTKIADINVNVDSNGIDLSIKPPTFSPAPDGGGSEQSPSPAGPTGASPEASASDKGIPSKTGDGAPTVTPTNDGIIKSAPAPDLGDAPPSSIADSPTGGGDPGVPGGTPTPSTPSTPDGSATPSGGTSTPGLAPAPAPGPVGSSTPSSLPAPGSDGSSTPSSLPAPGPLTTDTSSTPTPAPSLTTDAPASGPSSTPAPGPVPEAPPSSPAALGVDVPAPAPAPSLVTETPAPDASGPSSTPAPDAPTPPVNPGPDAPAPAPALSLVTDTPAPDAPAPAPSPVPDASAPAPAPVAEQPAPTPPPAPVPDTQAPPAPAPDTPVPTPPPSLTPDAPAPNPNPTTSTPDLPGPSLTSGPDIPAPPTVDTPNLQTPTPDPAPAAALDPAPAPTPAQPPNGDQGTAPTAGGGSIPKSDASSATPVPAGGSKLSQASSPPQQAPTMGDVLAPTAAPAANSQAASGTSGTPVGLPTPVAPAGVGTPGMPMSAVPSTPDAHSPSAPAPRPAAPQPAPARPKPATQDAGAGTNPSGSLLGDAPATIPVPPPAPRPPTGRTKAPKKNTSEKNAPKADAPKADAPKADAPAQTPSRSPGGSRRTGSKTPEMATPKATPIPPSYWKYRRGGATPAEVVTEIFDPSTNALGSNRPDGLLIGDATYVRTRVRRIQADSGGWVTDLTVTLPVRPGPGFSEAQLPGLQKDINDLLGLHINDPGYELPGSKDQININVVLTPRPDRKDAVDISVTPKGGDSDQKTFALKSPDAEGSFKTGDGPMLVHEVLHYAGVKDRYTDPGKLFRNDPSKTDNSGVMANTGADGLSAGLPADYLKQIETAITSGPVVRDHKLPPGTPLKPLSGAGTTPEDASVASYGTDGGPVGSGSSSFTFEPSHTNNKGDGDAPLRLARTKGAQWKVLGPKDSVNNALSWAEWKALPSGTSAQTPLVVTADQLSQQDLHQLTDHLAKAGRSDLAEQLQDYAKKLDAKAGTELKDLRDELTAATEAKYATEGDAQTQDLTDGQKAEFDAKNRRLSGQVAWDAVEIRQRANSVSSNLSDLVDTLSQHSGDSIPVHTRKNSAVLGLDAMNLNLDLSGFITNAQTEGGVYTLRNEISPVTGAAKNLTDLIASSTDGTLGPKPPVSPETLSGLAPAARDRRSKQAYAEVPTGTQWNLVKPGLDKLSPDEKAEFVKELSQKNVENLQNEVDGLLDSPELNAHAQEFRDFMGRVENLPFRLKHATPAYYAISNSGKMTSQGDLRRLDQMFLSSGKSSAANTGNLGNDDFVFFRVEVGDGPMNTRYGPTTMVFDATVLQDLGGWVSLHDQLHPLDRPAMQQLNMPGTGSSGSGATTPGQSTTTPAPDTPVRTSAYTPAVGGSGTRSEWTNTYPDGAKHTISFDQEVFHGDDFTKGIALSTVREVIRVGGPFQEYALSLTDPADLGKLVSSMYRPEAKFGAGLPVDLTEGKNPNGWPAPITVHNKVGDGRFNPNGTFNVPAFTAAKKSDTAADYARQGDNALETYKAILKDAATARADANAGNTDAAKIAEAKEDKAPGADKRVMGFYKKAVENAQEAVNYSEWFAARADSGTKPLAEQLLKERKDALDAIKKQADAAAALINPGGANTASSAGTSGKQQDTGGKGAQAKDKANHGGEPTSKKEKKKQQKKQKKQDQGQTANQTENQTDNQGANTASPANSQTADPKANGKEEPPPAAPNLTRPQLDAAAIRAGELLLANPKAPFTDQDAAALTNLDELTGPRATGVNHLADLTKEIGLNTQSPGIASRRPPDQSDLKRLFDLTKLGQELHPGAGNISKPQLEAVRKITDAIRLDPNRADGPHGKVTLDDVKNLINDAKALPPGSPVSANDLASLTDFAAASTTPGLDGNALDALFNPVGKAQSDAGVLHTALGDAAFQKLEADAAAIVRPAPANGDPRPLSERSPDDFVTLVETMKILNSGSPTAVQDARTFVGQTPGGELKDLLQDAVAAEAALNSSPPPPTSPVIGPSGAAPGRPGDNTRTAPPPPGGQPISADSPTSPTETPAVDPALLDLLQDNLNAEAALLDQDPIGPDETGAFDASKAPGRSAPPLSEIKPAREVTDFQVVTPNGTATYDGLSPDQVLQQAPFTSRDPKMVTRSEIADDGSAASFPSIRPSRPVIAEAAPVLKVSGDGTLAINTSAGRIKEFYAVPEAVTKANTALDQSGSKIKLRMDPGTYVTFDNEGTPQQLYKVKPDYSSELSDVCRDFSEGIVGGTHTHMVLYDARPSGMGGTGKVSTARIDTKSPVEVAGSHHLVQMLTEAIDNPALLDKVSPQGAAAQVTKAMTEPESTWPTPGEAWGSAQNTADPAQQFRNQGLKALEATLGVNQSAFAKPGEAYNQSSIASRVEGTTRDFKPDFTAPDSGGFDVPGDRSGYGYHFGAVVLESLDGNHQVSVENANFRSLAREQIETLVDENLSHYAGRFDDVKSSLDQAVAAGTLPSGDPRFRLLESLQKLHDAEAQLAALKQAIASGTAGPDAQQQLKLLENAPTAARRDAVRAMTAVFAEELGSAGDMWFVRMYGRAPGETFHDFQFRSPEGTIDVTNPLTTVVVAGQNNQHQEFALPPGTTTLDTTQQTILDRTAAKVAKAATWRAKQGLNPPHIEITVQSLPGEQSLADARAEAVRTAFQGSLETHLRQQPAGTSLTADDFPVTVRETGRDAQAVRDLFGDPEMDVHSQVLLDAFPEGNPADNVDLTPEQLTDLARETGVHKAEGLGGKAKGRFTPVTETELAAVQDLVKTAQHLDGHTTPPTTPRLTDLRRLGDVLGREYSHTGPLTPSSLDPLVRDVFKFAPDATVTPAQRRDLVDLVPAAKKSGKPVTAADLSAVAAGGGVRQVSKADRSGDASSSAPGTRAIPGTAPTASTSTSAADAKAAAKALDKAASAVEKTVSGSADSVLKDARKAEAAFDAGLKKGSLRLTDLERIRTEASNLAQVVHPGLTQFDAPRQNAVNSAVAQAFTTGGPGAALLTAKKIAQLDTLKGQLTASERKGVLDRAKDILKANAPGRPGATDPSVQQAQLLDVAHTLHTQGADAAAASAAALQPSGVVGSAGLSAFKWEYTPTASPNAVVMQFTPKSETATETAYWQQHTAGAADEVFFLAPAGPGAALHSGSQPMPWGGELTLYVSSHAGADRFSPALDNPKLGNTDGLVRTSPGHLAELVKQGPQYAALKEYAALTGRRLTIVPLSCELGADTLQPTLAAQEFANSFADEGVDVWGSGHVVAIGADGKVGAYADPDSDTAFNAYEPQQPGHAQIAWDESFAGAASFRSEVDNVWRDNPAAPSTALNEAMDSLGAQETYLVEGALKGGKVQAFTPDGNGGGAYQPLTMTEVADRLDDAGMPGDAPLVLAVNHAASGKLLGPDDTGADIYGTPPGQALADAKQGPVIAPWGEVFQGYEQGSDTPVLLVERPADLPADASWQPWVVFRPGGGDIGTSPVGPLGFSATPGAIAANTPRPTVAEPVPGALPGARGEGGGVRVSPKSDPGAGGTGTPPVTDNNDNHSSNGDGNDTEALYDSPESDQEPDTSDNGTDSDAIINILDGYGGDSSGTPTDTTDEANDAPPDSASSDGYLDAYDPYLDAPLSDSDLTEDASEGENEAGNPVPAEGTYRLVMPEGLQGDDRPFVTLEPPAVYDMRTDANPGAFPAYMPMREAEPQDPRLTVSEDGTVVVPDTGREIFITQENFAAANKELKLIGSNVTLRSHPDTMIRFTKNGTTHELIRVTPTFRSNPIDICRDFSQQVLGGYQTHAVLRSPNGGTTAVARINTSSATEVSGIAHLAQGIAEAASTNGEVGAEQAKALIQQGLGKVAQDWPAPGKEYKAFQATDPGAAQQAQDLGINEFALPKHIGEAMTSQGVPQLNAEGDRQLSLTRRGFGYHFASAVTFSGDGRSVVTLENVRRAEFTRAVLDDALRLNIEHYAGRLDETATQLRQRIDNGDLSADAPEVALFEKIEEIVELNNAIEAASTDVPGLEQQLTGATKEARRLLTAIAGDSLRRNGDAWYFRTYSTAPGTDLHTIENSSVVPNALTVVVLGDHGDQSVLLEGDRPGGQLTDADKSRLDKLVDKIAKVAVWRSREQLPPPVVEFNGGTTGGPLNANLQQKAALHLAERLTARFGEWAELGDGTPKLSSADIPFVFGPQIAPVPGQAGPPLQIDALMQGERQQLPGVSMPAPPAPAQAPASSVFAFTEGTRLTPEATLQIKRLAADLFKELRTAHQEGRPLPTVKITGYGNSRLTGMRDGRDRANKIAQLLRVELADALSRLRAANADVDGTFNPVAVPIKTTSRGNRGTAPEQGRRTAVIEVVAPS
ncbi:hypothetical protein SAMN04487981_101508 [Streptomyces sp. cf386]|uniref:WXG100-like domain-containing protein n=1 Tax=Streptomyces sp. cf386 TaxID=1761904 RepID=UPI000888CFDC|nr:hypothetical protein [Streptomyces sp. cf386]SDM43624.1 hypothetical protein SAMN04487981_101508 [Streptomyces sp. cf386]